MRWLCMFSACRWVHYFNVINYDQGVEIGDDGFYSEIKSEGVYQCTRCKTISVGAKR